MKYSCKAVMSQDSNQRYERKFVLHQPTFLDQAIKLSRLIEDKLTDDNSLSIPSVLTGNHTNLPPLLPKPNQSPLNRTMLPIKRLTPAEMMAKRENGLCFNCDEPLQSKS